MRKLISLFISFALCTGAIASQSGDVSLYIEKALESERMGKEMDAISYLTTAIQMDPKNVKALTERASLFMVFGDYEKALGDYRSALKVTPTEELYYKTGVAELNAGDDELAIDHLTNAIKINPKNEFYFYFRGEAKRDLGQYRPAIEDFNKAVSLKPDDYQAVYKRGICYFSVHDYQKAVTDFNYAIKIYSYDPEIYYYRGVSYFNISKFSNAIDDFSVVLEKNPENHDALVNRAMAYEYTNKYTEADKDYSQFIAQHPNNPQINYAAANVKYSIGDFKGAEEFFTMVISSQENHKMAYFHRGMARFNQRKIDEACSDFVKAKQLGYLAGYEQMKGNCK